MHKHKHIKRVKSAKKKDFIDKLIYPAAIATPLMTLPQLYIVWIEKEAGASLITWAAYTVIAAIWLVYAIKTKDVPLIILEAPSLVLYAAISIGILMFGLV